ncbi:FtsX-like permease family protein [Lysinibacter sp. HNR]|uniref:ABC transporter permease n=1 Tax=Lysinibacter sp. HNR TaxID=3031408 RepID=UPI00243594F1|nr:FtsX-like permease family protein [Lysinibacter sp. HNR]WGD36884.1 FtsX-like permease family protein [Lysinibacter sp. HNR]
MRSILLSTLRSHSGRLIATAVAIVLSVAFVVATLLLSATFTETSANKMTTNLKNADLVIQVGADAVLDEDGERKNRPLDGALETVRDLSDVAAADIEAFTFVPVDKEGQRSFAKVEGLLEEGVRWQELESGGWPTATDEAVIDALSADTLGVNIGDQLKFTWSDGDDAELTIVGLSGAQNIGVFTGAPLVTVTQEALTQAEESSVSFGGILVRGTDFTNPEQLAEKVSAALAGQPGLSVETRDAVVAKTLEEVSGGADVLTLVLLSFAAIALLVSGFVIANTFQVLVAQRTRDLALLRCVGASSAQVRRLVLVEAVLVGLIASVLGAVLGIVAAHLMVALSQGAGPSGALEPLIVSPLTLIIGLVVGIVVTVFAALGPARRATRVHPVAAMRPVEAVAQGRVPAVRVILGSVLTLVGVCGLILGATSGITLALGAGAVSAIGVLLLGVVYFPPALRLAGRAISWISTPAQLAVANSTRNPLRTTATATALLIGVTLVTMMATGVSSARESFTKQIDEGKPVDLIVSAQNDTGLTEGVISAVTGNENIAAVAPVKTGKVTVTLPDGEEVLVTAEGMNPAETQAISHSPIELPEPGSIWLGSGAVDPSLEGSWVSVSDEKGGIDEVSLKVHLVDDLNWGRALLAPQDLVSLLGDPVVGKIQIKLLPDLGVQETQSVITDMTSLSEEIVVSGGVQERLMLTQIFDTIFLVTLALLAVAIIIALVGIGNTTALSILERKRESALLRAVGLERRQLVSMVVIEAALSAAVAAIIGLVLGILFAWAGVSALGVDADKFRVFLSPPWGQLVLVGVVAVVAGVAAALLPAYAASRRSPVRDLASD